MNCVEHNNMFYIDNDEPLLSGSGIVSREISDIALARWDTTLTQWQISIKKNITGNKLALFYIIYRHYYIHILFNI